MMDISQAALSESSSQGDDSDDNFLYVQPVALMQDSTPFRSKDPAQTLNSTITDDLESTESNQPCLVIKKLKYSLDRIVQTNNAQDKSDTGLANLHESLRHGIVEGGITKMIEDEEEQQGSDREAKTEGREHELNEEGLESGNIADASLLPEHEETLQQYALENEKIATLHPGEDVFCNADIGKLFTFPVGLSLSGNPNAMEKLVMRATQEELEELLMSRTILDIYLVKQCPDSVMLWLLQLLSVCDSVMVAGMIFDIMWSLMNSLQHLHPTAKPWCPTLQDIASIFVNYGASLTCLLPPSLVQTHFTLDDITNSWNEGKINSEQTKPSCVPAFNLQQVIKIITQCLVTQHGRPSLSQQDLMSLTYLVCKVSLDKQLVRCPVQVDFHHCLAAILNCFQDDTWNIQAGKICQILIECSNHHHNLVYLVRLMRTGTLRGKVICPMLSCAFLQKLTNERDAVEQECSRDREVKVSDLIPLLAAIKPKRRADIDYYQLHSLVTLVELAVGYDKDLYQSSDKEALARLVIMLRDMAGDIRESHKHLCRTQVKDLIIRIASELTYLEQTLTSKQTFLHTFMKYEQIEDSKKTDKKEEYCHGNGDSEDVCHKNQDADDTKDRVEKKMTER